MSKVKSITKLAFALHSWLGLICGVFFLLLGLSGSALVFLKEIDHMINADLLRVEPSGEVLSLDTIYRKIGVDHPNLRGIAWLNADAAPDEAYEFRLYQNDGKLSTYDLGLVNINPYSGAVLRQGNLKDLNTGFMQWLVQFHWSFQLGLPGLLLTTVFGVTMLLSMITGIIIYRKYVWKMLCFKVRIKTGNWRTMSSGIHRLVGVWALAFNVIIFFTGFWMNMFSLDPGYWRSQLVTLPPNSLSVQSVDQMLRAAKRSMPDLITTKVYMPTQPGKDFKVSGRVKGNLAVLGDVNAVTFDPANGQVKSIVRFAEMSIAERLEATFHPLHVGNFGGTAIKILYVIIGLLPGLLSVTGALLWWRRKK